MGEIIYEDTDKTELKTTENHGRGLFATKCIGPGTTILTELPYAWAIMNQYRPGVRYLEPFYTDLDFLYFFSFAFTEFELGKGHRTSGPLGSSHYHIQPDKG